MTSCKLGNSFGSRKGQKQFGKVPWFPSCLKKCLKTCFPIARVFCCSHVNPSHQHSSLQSQTRPVGVVLGSHAMGNHRIQELALNIHQTFPVAALLSSACIIYFPQEGPVVNPSMIEVHNSNFDKAWLRRNGRRIGISPMVRILFSSKKKTTPHPQPNVTTQIFPPPFHHNCLLFHHVFIMFLIFHHIISSIFPPFSHILPYSPHIFPCFPSFFSFFPAFSTPKPPLHRIQGDPRLGWPPPSGRRDPGASAVDQRPRSRWHPRRRHRPGRLGRSVCWVTALLCVRKEF